MKTIDIISATPELLISPFSGSIMKRAIEKEIVQVNFHDLKDYSNKNELIYDLSVKKCRSLQTKIWKY